MSAEPSQPAPPEAAASAPAPTSDPRLVGYPLVRLRSATNPVEALDLPLPAADLAALGVKSYAAFTATAPQIWLLVFEFESQAALLDRSARVDALLPADGPPYHRQPSYTGSWLLITGFPSDKPVSPEMQFARAEFIGGFAGEE